MKIPTTIIFALAVTLLGVSCRSTPKVTTHDPVVGETVAYPRGVIRYDLADAEHNRYYMLYVPPSLNLTSPVPLVMVLHGGGGTPEMMMQLTGFNRIADQFGFMVVYPSGTGASERRLFWNVLQSETYATVQRVDDLGFLDRVVTAITNTFPVNTRRVYATGFSQGGMMCYRMACDEVWSATVAAIAPVSAVMTMPRADCLAMRPIPVLAIHGVKDPIILYEGGISTKIPRHERLKRASFSESVGFWIQRNELDQTPMASGIRGAAEMKQYGANAAGIEVITWSLQNGGHTWPGGNEPLPEWLVGKVNRDIDASLLIWDFFSRHQLP